MTNPVVRLLLWGAVLTGLLRIGAGRTGPVPPLGELLDPLHGIWGVAGTAELPPEELAAIPGLEGEVQVVYDDRRVPHIFAGSEADAHRALGYVVARDRLFQLELQARATEGTLTELAGSAALEADRQSRRIGLAWSARRDFERIREDPAQLGPLEAYAAGVNAYIASLTPGERPFEYHLLGARPRRWEPIHTVYLLKRMGWTLSYMGDEMTKARVASMVGSEAADGLFPVDSPIQEPIVPYRGARWVGATIPDPGEPTPSAPVQLEAVQALLTPGRAAPGADGPVVGSNNWAVSAERSASGAAILAGDPHLNLTLPSIWYEAHMVVPGELDVAGVTLVGTPGIVIGFNRDVAWSFTNTGSDVMDLYRERFDDDGAPTAYRLDGEWRPLQERIEAFRGPDGAVLATDTLFHTHRGPVLQVNDTPMSLRWTVLEDQQETRALLEANRAGSIDEWLRAMERWHAPTQNGLVADRSGRIAIQSAGYYPDRPADTRGDWFFDGTTSASDWVGSLSRYPRAVDPEQGYLASANQQPWDPDAEALFIGANWPSPWRALTINRLLRERERHSAADLQAYQTHPTGERARVLHRLLMEAADRLGREGRTTPALDEAVRLLSEWDLRYDPDNERTALFEHVVRELQRSLWDELRREDGSQAGYPGTAVLWALMDQPQSPWWDDRSTPEVEDRDLLIGLAFERGLAATKESLGPEPGPNWRWSDASNKNIYHLLQLPALSRTGLPVTGGPELLSPNTGSGTHGASWRMVVELGEEVLPRATYPGGQSGNPVSSAYDDRLADWLEGTLDDVRFPRSAGELEAEGLRRSGLTLSGGGT